MAEEALKFLGNCADADTDLITADTEHVLLDIIDAAMFVKSGNAGSGILVVDDAALDITLTGSGKQLKVVSDGTLVGTTVSTADDVTELDNVSSVTIEISSAGLKIVVSCSPVGLAITT